MLDIIPHSADAPRGRPSGDSRNRPSARKPSKNVLKVDWKLPARLRKPIRPQLVAERKAKRAKILGGFSRRPITTQRLITDMPIQNIGAEHHTADIYRESVPNMRLVAPPYVGAAVKQAFHVVSGPNRRRQAREKTGLTLSPSAALPVSPRQSVQEPVLPQEEEFHAVVEKPKRRLRLPFSIDWLTPPRPQGAAELTSFEKDVKEVKKKVFSLDRNIAILLVGCLVSSSVIWNLQGLGRGWGALTGLQGQAKEAVGHLLSAQSALADSDFLQSEAAFADAATLLTSTRQELDDSLAASRHVLEVVDVSGTVRSGDRLLSAAEKLAQSGEQISRGLSLLLSAKVLKDLGEAQTTTPTLVEAIEKSRGEFEGARDRLAQAEEDLKQVHSSLLPKDVQEAAKQLQNGVPRAHGFLTQFLDQSNMLLTLLGSERQRDYLLVFANNHELRPVGGFLGSVGLISVDRGVVEQIDVNTVYDGDGQLKDFIAPPEPLRPIVNRWYLRDSNWFVDFSVSATKAAQFFEKEGGPTADGVILMTPDVISDLLKLSGPIEMPAYGVTVTADTFTEITQREVTYEYDRSLNKPKQFLADLTPVLLNRILGQRGGESLQLLSTLTGSLGKKDLLMHFRDEELQKKVEELGWAGKIPQGLPGLTYVNNANIGGHKSDQFIEQEIDERVEVARDGTAEVVLTIRRTHHGPTEAITYDFPDWENPAEKDNVVFQRVLVPAGAKLLEAKGFTSANEVPKVVSPETYLNLSADPDVVEWQRGQVQDSSGTILGHEAGYSFFANWMITKPGQTTVGLYRYRLPDKVPLPGVLTPVSRWAAYIVKQPGAERTSARVTITLPESVRTVTTAPESGVTPLNNHEFTYRGELTRDLVTGAVFESR